MESSDTSMTNIPISINLKINTSRGFNQKINKVPTFVFVLVKVKTRRCAVC